MLEIADNEPSIIKNLVLKEAAKRKVDAEVVHLEVADFVWDNSIAIERKTVPDFIGSVRDGRLFSQAIDMAQYNTGYVVITGDFKGLAFDPRLKSFSVAHKLGAQASLLARTGVKLWQVDNRGQFVHALFLIKDKSDKGPKSFFVERHSKTANRHDPNLALFMAIPGVGPSMAKRILMDYSSFYELMYDIRKGHELQTKIPKDGLLFLQKACGVE